MDADEHRKTAPGTVPHGAPKLFSGQYLRSGNDLDFLVRGQDPRRVKRPIARRIKGPHPRRDKVPLCEAGGGTTAEHREPGSRTSLSTAPRRPLPPLAYRMRAVAVVCHNGAEDVEDRLATDGAVSKATRVCATLQPPRRTLSP